MASPRAPSIPVLLALVVLLAASGGGAAWFFSIQQLERRIARKRAALKPLQLAGRIPPNRQVNDYLAGRTAAVEAAYASAIKELASTAAALEQSTNPQLYFQERVHDAQRTLERLPAARQPDRPLQLGFPKELPPADVVPRLLVQLSLIEDAAELILAQGHAKLISAKLEDPEPLPPPSEEQASFLMRLPVRFRFESSLVALLKILGMVERAKPFIDLQGFSTHLATSSAEETSLSGDSSTEPSSHTASRSPERLEVDLVLARYLVTAPELPPTEEGAAPAQKGARPTRKSPASRRSREAE